MSNGDDQNADGGDGGGAGKLLEPENWRVYTRYPFILAKFLVWGGAATLVYLSLSTIGDVLFPVFVSMVIAYLLDPVVDWFEERGYSRTVGILFVMLGGLLLGTGFVLFLYPTFVAQIDRVIQRAPELLEMLRTRTIPWIEKTFDYRLPATVSEAVKEYGESLTDYLPEAATQAGQWAAGIASGTGAVVAGALNIVMIPIFSFYFLRDFDRIRLKIGEFIPQHRRDFMLDRLAKMDEVVGEWVRGQLQVAGLLAVLYAIGLGAVFAGAGIDLQSGIAIGLLSGMLNFIPYLGVAIGMVLSVLIVLINFNTAGFAALVGVLAVFVFCQMLEGYWITPRIVGGKVGLSPVTVIIMLLIGGELFGLLGVLLAIPIFGALKVLFPDIVAYYKQTAFYRGRKKVPSGEVDAERVIRARRAEERRDRAAESGEAEGETERDDETSGEEDASSETESERSDGGDDGAES